MGWRLIAVLENETPLAFSDTENFQTSHSSTDVYTNMGRQQFGVAPSGYITAMNTRYHPTKSQTFLLVQDEESVAARLQNRVKELEGELAGLRKESGDARKQFADAARDRDGFQSRLKDLIDTQARTIEQVTAGSKALADYKAEVAEKLKAAEEVIAKDRALKKTAYERVVEGGFDDDVEGVEVGAVG